jgi:hypothetical protein
VCVQHDEYVRVFVPNASFFPPHKALKNKNTGTVLGKFQFQPEKNPFSLETLLARFNFNDASISYQTLTLVATS